jgi:hypothetical protein
MKTLAWIGCLLCLGLAAPLIAQDTPKSPDTGPITIISAVYGSGDRFSDVTERTQVLLSRGEPFYASPQWLREDPTPGWNKAFVILYTYKDERRIFTVGENGEVTAGKLTKWKPW